MDSQEFRLIEEKRMHPPALYYPYIHVRDEDWLKTAALYWPAVHRLVPAGYPIDDTATARAFADAEVLRNENPGLYVFEAESSFESALARNVDLLEARFRVHDAEHVPHPDFVPSPNMAIGVRPENLGWIHVQKIPPSLVDEFVARGFAIRGRPDPNTGRDWGSHTPGREWVGFHRAVAGAYMTALASQVSGQGRFQPLTDVDDLRKTIPHPDVEAALRLLTGVAPAKPEATEAYVMLALETVLPTNLDQVPVEAILRCREELQPKLEAFRSHVDAQVDELRQIAAVPAEHRRLEEFARHVQGTIEQPLRDLERDLRLLKLETVRSLVTTSTYAPPAIIGAGLTYLAEPAATVAGSVAAAIGKAWWDVRQGGATIRSNSPVGFLLDVRHQLTPASAGQRFERLFRRGR
ncbi:DUF6236 family protein [Myceligenerans salitolerans]|uniref:Uncharacterized protein n=1 Tax=Myceligenerans salitolerans TaxID=1230528 RepID=A0ABS3IB74_9MICO|nr:DUF6236 family protein [Myceligenerans salitolerans]MBO0609871.1 hypothetical protein [Myceligenerans salitolerans]